VPTVVKGAMCGGVLNAQYGSLNAAADPAAHHRRATTRGRFAVGALNLVIPRRRVEDDAARGVLPAHGLQSDTREIYEARAWTALAWCACSGPITVPLLIRASRSF